jgi:hypothetical protein
MVLHQPSWLSKLESAGFNSEVPPFLGLTPARTFSMPPLRLARMEFHMTRSALAGT